MAPPIDLLQRFLAAVAAPGREVVRVAPFTLYLDRTDPLRYLSYAIPDAGAGGAAAAAALPGLRAVFRARERLPRLEYLHEHAPALAAALAAGGMEQELSTPLMALEPAALRTPAVDVPGARVAPLADADLHAFCDAQGVAFGEPPLAADAAPRDPRAGGGAVVAVRVDGAVIAGASCSPVVEGVAEVRGVFTVERLRGRGLAGLATAAAAQAAFAAGATTCVLTPGGDVAMRVYARAGFAPVARSEYWADAER